ncbi:MAG: hypothetical protein M1495_09045 [Bacteroidetes bacterium]|nr:hypothetical protein [Bacteroidota bacterium]
MIHNRRNIPDYEKLRDELFKVSVDYKAWMRSLKIIAIAITIILTLLAFFGYDKIDTIEKTILERANLRLAKTDSILSKIDDKKINELNMRLVEKEKQYEQTLSNFEKLLSQNEKIEDRILQLLPNNKRIEYKLSTYIIKSPEDYFQIKPIKNIWHSNEIMNLYLVFNDNFDLKKVTALRFQLSDSKYLVKDYYFQNEQRFNKIEITLDVGKGDYFFEFGFITKENNEDVFYRFVKKIKIL